MQVVYAQQPLPSEVSASIFLAGPTPRSEQVSSWRPQALELLRKAGFTGTVFVPEFEQEVFSEKINYEAQVSWEEQALSRADVLLFWIPREMQTMPALTTNDEWGYWKSSGRAILGAPPEAQKLRYQRWWAEKLVVPSCSSLEETVQAALTLLGPITETDRRSGGAASIPLLIWRRPEFQRWYQRLCEAGNRLDDARVRWVHRAGPKRRYVVLWSLQVSVFITKEQRSKTNEVLLGRADTANLLLYRKGETLRDTKVLLIREFRSAGTSCDGYVHELPGGSSLTSQDPQTVALEELEEEAGIRASAASLTAHGARALAATLAVHHGHLFSLAVTEEQFREILAGEGIARGLQEHSEMTYTEVRTVGSLLDQQDVDWSTLGMILSVLANDVSRT